MSEQEVNKFVEKIIGQHRRISPCFMTGKGCVYTEQIDREIERCRKNGENIGFTVIPFQPNSSVFYELCLKRYVRGAYRTENEKSDLLRADQVRKTGYVICEKICKKIQESSFIIVDISVPNANVFYELGLAFGIDQKIIVMRHDKSEFGRQVEKYLSPAGCKVFSYSGLFPLTIEAFPLSNYVWKRTFQPLAELSPTMLLFDFLDFFGGDVPKNIDQEAKQSTDLYPEDIPLSFSAHLRAAIAVSIEKIIPRIGYEQQSIKMPEIYYPLIKQLRETKEVPRSSSFKDVLETVEQSFCTVIRTGGKNCNPMMYFWLGYCHARGRNVIPITVMTEKGEKIDDLAFDIRALWHMTFVQKKPSLLEVELEETLHQMILSDFTEWSRRRLWDELLEKRGKVSIFTGALHNPIGREMIGDWDLRVASELTSHFARHQYRATIESPVYQIEQVVDKQQSVDRKEYIQELEKMLWGKNCIIIASPDVNPLTEIVLGKIYGIDKDKWFGAEPSFSATGIPNTVIVFKSRMAGEDVSTSVLATKRTFYQEFPENSDEGEAQVKRGFLASFLPGGQITGGFISQTETPKEFNVHAHLVIVPNPYRAPEDQKYIIILNGVSGPATFALTQVLTGGMSNEFVAYGSNFDPNSASEELLRTILEDMNTMRQTKRKNGFQYIFNVKVGILEAPEAEIKRTAIFDWRHICHWELKKSRIFELPEYA